MFLLCQLICREDDGTISGCSDGIKHVTIHIQVLRCTEIYTEHYIIIISLLNITNNPIHKH